MYVLESCAGCNFVSALTLHSQKGHSMSNHPNFQAFYTSPSPILMELSMYIGPIETGKNPKFQLDQPIGYRVMAF